MKFSIFSKHLSFNIIFLIGTFVLIFINEIFVYKMASFKWTPMIELQKHHLSSENTKILKILFVADPQIVGNIDEPQFVGYFSRLDCDRYLRAGFSEALAHTTPDVVIFLGDIFDEGSKASTQDFNSYVQRFESIFPLPDGVQRIMIPGDNDVGGEGFEKKSPSKVKRFHSLFDDKVLSTIKFADIIKLNIDYGGLIDDSIIKGLQHTESPIRILCNHMTISKQPSSIAKQIIKELNLNVIFSAHSHLSLYYQYNGDRNILAFDLYNVRVKHFDTKHEVYEINVPTCSYRMGVPNMAYGAAVMDSKGLLSYTLLWLPSRYHSLYSYLILIALFVFVKFFVHVRNFVPMLINVKYRSR